MSGNKKFFYEDCEGKRHYLTLKTAAPEWCNRDCPTIYSEATGTRLNNQLEANNINVNAFREFVKKSSEAFYKKYPSCYKGVNGFLKNFDYLNKSLL